MEKHEPIAIVGLGCRFPGAPDPSAFWQLLRDGKDAITEVPSARWDGNAFYDPDMLTPGTMNTRWGGFLDDVAGFDPHFFGISPYEATYLDPQQRLLLEVTWETLEQAAITSQQMAHRHGGVFVAVRSSGYLDAAREEMSLLSAYSVVGSIPSAAANRLSALLQWRGPCLAVDTGCSSALVAVHLACQSLWAGESEMALAGGVNLLLTPVDGVAIAQMGILAADGRCKSFDASGDGFVRSEGCGLLLLQRLSDAQRDCHQVLALIESSAVNYGSGRSFVAPSGAALEGVIRQVLGQAQVEPGEIDFIEAHGVGSQGTDTVELQALRALFDSVGMEDRPCWIGSVKANIGHAELASGSASLIKTVLSLQQGEIPPQIHFQSLPPDISLDRTPLQVITSPQPWRSASRLRRALVNSFGVGGTNACLLLAEAPSLPYLSLGLKPDRPKHLLMLSARDEGALREMVDRYIKYLTEHSTVSLADLCYSANIGRTAFAHRLVVVAATPVGLAEALKNEVLASRVQHGDQPTLAFFFQGSGMCASQLGRELYESQSTFRVTVERCAQLLQPLLSYSLLSLLFEPDAPGDHAEHALRLFVLGYALAEMWQGWGIVPDIVMGVGSGEVVAACVVGVLSLEEGLRVVMGQRDSVGLPSTVRGWHCATGTLVDLPSVKECDILLEIGSVSSRSGGLNSEESVWLIGQPSWDSVLSTMAMLAASGMEVDWVAWDRDYPRQRVSLPIYPFQRQRYWLERPRPERGVVVSGYGWDRSILEQVAQVLGVEPGRIGIDHSLREIGLDSLMSIELQSRLRRKLGVELPTTLLLRDPSLADLLTWVQSQSAHGTPSEVLVNLQPNGSRVPLFCVTAGYGDMQALLGLAHALGPDQPFYGLQPPSLSVNSPGATLLQALVTQYLDATRSVQPRGPYYLAGYSSGGLVAFEMAQQLERQGESVALLALLDTPFRVSHFQHWTQQVIEPFRMVVRLFRLTRQARTHSLRAILAAALADRGLSIHIKATVGYQPRRYPGRVTLFLASIPYPGYGYFHRQWPGKWRGVAGAGLEVRTIPGNHYSMLRQPEVQQLATELRASLGLD